MADTKTPTAPAPPLPDTVNSSRFLFPFIVYNGQDVDHNREVLGLLLSFPVDSLDPETPSVEDLEGLFQDMPPLKGEVALDHVYRTRQVCSYARGDLEGLVADLVLESKRIVDKLVKEAVHAHEMQVEGAGRNALASGVATAEPRSSRTSVVRARL